MNFKLFFFLQCIVLSSSKIDLKQPQVYEDVNETPAKVNQRVWRQPQMDLQRWRYTQQQNSDSLNLSNFGKKKREIQHLFSSPPLYLIQQIPVNLYQQPKYQIEMLNGLIGKNPQVQLKGLQQLLEMDKPITENVLDVANPQKQPNIQVDDNQLHRDYFVQAQEKELLVQPPSEPVYQPAPEPTVTKKEDDGVSINNSAKSRKRRGADDYYYYEYEMVDEGKNNNNDSEVIYEYVYEDDGGDKMDFRVKGGSIRKQDQDEVVVMEKYPVVEQEKYPPVVEQEKYPPFDVNLEKPKENPADDYKNLDNQLLSLLEKRKRLKDIKKLNEEILHLEQEKNHRVLESTTTPMVIKRYVNGKPAKVSPGYSSIENAYYPLLQKHLNIQNLKNKRETDEDQVAEDSEEVYSTIKEEYHTSLEDKRPVNLIVINNSNDNHKSKETKHTDQSKTEIVKQPPTQYHPPPITVLPAPVVQPVIKHVVHKPPHHHHRKKHHHRRPHYRIVPSKKSSKKRILTKIHNAFIKFGI